MFKRHLKLIRWSIGIVGGVLAGLWIAVLVSLEHRPPAQKLVEALNEKLDADVELESFSVKTFPLLRIHGDDLKLRLKGQTNPAPFIEVNHFEVSSGLFGLLHRQKRFSRWSFRACASRFRRGPDTTKRAGQSRRRHQRRARC